MGEGGNAHAAGEDREVFQIPVSMMDMIILLLIYLIASAVLVEVEESAAKKVSKKTIVEASQFAVDLPSNILPSVVYEADYAGEEIRGLWIISMLKPNKQGYRTLADMDFFFLDSTVNDLKRVQALSDKRDFDYGPLNWENLMGAGAKIDSMNLIAFRGLLNSKIRDKIKKYRAVPGGLKITGWLHQSLDWGVVSNILEAASDSTMENPQGVQLILRP